MRKYIHIYIVKGVKMAAQEPHTLSKHYFFLFRGGVGKRDCLIRAVGEGEEVSLTCKYGANLS